MPFCFLETFDNARKKVPIKGLSNLTTKRRDVGIGIWKNQSQNFCVETPVVFHYADKSCSKMQNSFQVDWSKTAEQD